MTRRNRKLPRALFSVLFALAASCPPGAFALTSEEINTISTYEKVAASVVNISTEVCEPEFFFCSVPTSGTGSGVVVKEDGLILTNHHVIAHARDIQVTLEDGRRMKAEIAGTAPLEDLAVLRVDVKGHALKAITMADSDKLQVGEKVLAIGNPFGLGQTLTKGTVSMVGRDIKNDGRILRGLIQTDADVNPGNSGGALVDSDGELVGVNTIILSPTGSSVGIGFAIPSNRVKQVLPGLAHPWQKWLGWLLAVLLLGWILRRIYRAGAQEMTRR